jgi:glycosyltransferase involved in cell wall biosynthesis
VTSLRVLEIPHFYLPHLGGTELYVHRLARELRAREHDCRVISASESRPEGAGSALVHGIPVTYLRSRHLLPRNPFLFGLREQLRRQRPDVVHLHSLWYLCSLTACLAQRELGVAIVSSMHGILPDLPTLGARAFLRGFRPLAQQIANRSDAIVVLNRAEREKLRAVVRVSEEKVHTIEAGVDVAAPDERVSQRLREELSPYLLFSGRIIPDKNPELLVDAFARIAAQHPSLKLLFLGSIEPGYRARLLARAGRGRERILFRAPLDPVGDAAALASHYACAEASVAIGTWEGQPTRLIESMVHGVPAIAFPSGGVAELVRDGSSGILLEALSADALARAITRLLGAAPETRASLCAGARAAVAQSLWPDKAARLIALIEQVGAAARGRRK